MNLKMLCCLTVFCLGVPAALGDADIHEGCNMEKISSYGDACRLIRNWIGKMVEEGKIPSSKAANLEQALDALEKGADVKGPEGKRALMAAAALGGKEMVEFLFSKGGAAWQRGRMEYSVVGSGRRLRGTFRPYGTGRDAAFRHGGRAARENKNGLILRDEAV